MISLNNQFILTPYQQGQGIRTEIRGGLALPGQKLNLIPLTMLADVSIEGNLLKAGSTAYVAEDFLMTQEWAKKVRKAPGIEGEFIMVPSQFVSIVKGRDEQ